MWFRKWVEKLKTNTKKKPIGIMEIIVFLREAECPSGEYNGHVNLLLIKTEFRGYLLQDLGRSLPSMYILSMLQPDLVIYKVHTQELAQLRNNNKNHNHPSPSK